MTPRIHLVTLGVADLARSRRFYVDLGLSPSSASNDDVAFFDVGGVVLGLYGREPLAADARTSAEGAGFRAVSLAWNQASKADVDAALALAVKAGGTLQKPAEDAFWGGYSGYFADPDGHLWEVAYNPLFPFDESGHLTLPR
jgi:catechol 2,3-dioxygenase-like lactoylglutathione lyase family enzyme